MIEIWQPRYKDNKVLIATYKVHSGKNYLKFTKAKHLEGMVFSFDGDDIRNYPVQKNGATTVYVYPMDKIKLESEKNNE